MRYIVHKSVEEFADSQIQSTLIKSKLLKLIFWSLTTLSVFFGFFSSIMSVMKLASSRFQDSYSLFIDLFSSEVEGKTVDQWPIFVLWMGIFLSICSGLLSLFLVKSQWLKNKKRYNNLLLEKAAFQNSLGAYEKMTSQENKRVLYLERISEVLKYNDNYILRKMSVKNEK